jgi:hypothetical protein
MSKRLFAVVLTAGILLATGALLATVAIGPSFAGPGNTCNGTVR